MKLLKLLLVGLILSLTSYSQTLDKRYTFDSLYMDRDIENPLSPVSTINIKASGVFRLVKDTTVFYLTNSEEHMSVPFYLQSFMGVTKNPDGLSYTRNWIVYTKPNNVRLLMRLLYENDSNVLIAVIIYKDKQIMMLQVDLSEHNPMFQRDTK